MRRGVQTVRVDAARKPTADCIATGVHAARAQFIKVSGPTVCNFRKFLKIRKTTRDLNK